MSKLPSKRIIPIKTRALLLDLILKELDQNTMFDQNFVCSKIELAHWHYLDYMVPSQDNLPDVGFMEFLTQIVRSSPDPIKAFSPKQMVTDYNKFRSNLSVCGAIIFSPAFDKVLLVQNFKTHTWGFPKGKEEKDELSWQCAVREVKEETGLDVSHLINPENYISVKYWTKPIKLFIFRGVEAESRLKPKVMGEIQSVKWFTLNHIFSSTKENNTYLTENMEKIQEYVVNALKLTVEKAKREATVISTSQISSPAVKPVENSEIIVNDNLSEDSLTIQQNETEKTRKISLFHGLSDWNFLSPAFQNFHAEIDHVYSPNLATEPHLVQVP